jgi:hypothetical protein
MKTCKKGAHQYPDEKRQCPECRKIYQKGDKSREYQRRKAAEFRLNNPDKAKAALAKWRVENKQSMAESSAKWKSANPEKVVKARATFYLHHKCSVDQCNKDWAEKNREKSNQIKTRWAETNPGKIKVALRSYYAGNKEKFLHHGRVRRARVMQSKGELSFDIEKRLYVFQGGLCACCGKPLGNDYHLDHVVPLSRSGDNSDGNVQLLRKRCNHQKNAKNPVVFMKENRGDYAAIWAKRLVEWRQTL